jgi:hypothetical protein
MKLRIKHFKSILIALVLLSPATTSAGSSRQDITLEQFKWKSRLIVLIATSPQHADVEKQKQFLSGADEGLNDRDLKVIEIYSTTQGFLDGQPLPQESFSGLRANLELPGQSFQFLLVGKDGTVKLRSNRAVIAAEIFALIDSMPMRQREMEENRK